MPDDGRSNSKCQWLQGDLDELTLFLEISVHLKRGPTADTFSLLDDARPPADKLRRLPPKL